MQAIVEVAEVNPPTDLRGLRDDSLISFIPMSEVTDSGRWIGSQERRLDEVRAGYTPFADGDILFAKITPCMENGKGAHAKGLRNSVGFGSTEFHVLRARGQNDPRYLFHCLQARPARLRAIAFMGGSAGQQRVQSDFFKQFHILRIEPAEQSRIAMVLDTIDEAIVKTEAVVAKLTQVGAGLLHDLLTRGLNEHGQLRDPIAHPEQFHASPVGRVPREWSVVADEELCSEIVDCPHSTPKYITNGVPCIRTADMEPGRLLLDQAFKVSEETYRDRTMRLVPRCGDVIYSREGERLGIASPVGPERVCLGQRVMLLRPKQETDPAYLLWAMNAPFFYRQVLVRIGATTSPHVNVADVRRFQIPRPHPTEQAAIGAAIRGINIAINQETRQLAKLKLIKEGCMSDLLTGRVRVPEGMEVAS